MHEERTVLQSHARTESVYSVHPFTFLCGLYSEVSGSEFSFIIEVLPYLRLHKVFA
jgi:hypothetical protein